MGLSLTEAGIGTLLLAAVITLIWKSNKKGKRHHGWLALLAGLFSATTVVGILSIVVSPSSMIFGAGAMTLIMVVTGIITWHETVKGRDPHHLRTPIAAFLLGASLATVFGGVRAGVSSTTTQVTSYVHQIPSSGFGGK